MAIPFPNPQTLEEMQANRRALNVTFFPARPRMKNRLDEQPTSEPVHDEPPPAVEREPFRPNVSDRAAKILDAVATVAGISVSDLLVEQTRAAAAARQVAVAVLVRSIVAEPTDAAVICGLTFGAAHRALLRFDPVIDAEALPIVNAPIACIPRLWRCAMEELRTSTKTATFGDCIVAASRASRVPVHDIKTERRTRHLVKARQIAMWLGTQFTLLSLPAMGRGLGGRDHTTILHGARVVGQVAATIQPGEDWGLQEWADALWAAEWTKSQKGAA